MTQVPYHISVKHGNMLINVPRNLFRGPDCEFVDDKVKEFRRIMSGRYPWLTENSLDVLLRNARNEMLRITYEETGGCSTSKSMASKGKTDAAINHLRKYLERNPNDADSWYTLGELLCKSGNIEEGYKAMNKGRSLIEKE